MVTPACRCGGGLHLHLMMFIVSQLVRANGRQSSCAAEQVAFDRRLSRRLYPSVTPRRHKSVRCHSTPFSQARVWKTQQFNPTNRIKRGSNHTLANKAQFKQRINNKCHPHSILWSQEKSTQGLLENLLHQDKICHYCYKSMWSKMWWCAANPIPSSKASTQAPGKITGVGINLSKQTTLTSYLNNRFITQQFKRRCITFKTSNFIWNK